MPNGNKTMYSDLLTIAGSGQLPCPGTLSMNSSPQQGFTKQPYQELIQGGGWGGQPLTMSFTASYIATQLSINPGLISGGHVFAVFLGAWPQTPSKPHYYAKQANTLSNPHFKFCCYIMTHFEIGHHLDLFLDQCLIITH